jgi:hypothetical protein
MPYSSGPAAVSPGLPLSCYPHLLSSWSQSSIPEGFFQDSIPMSPLPSVAKCARMNCSSLQLSRSWSCIFRTSDCFLILLQQWSWQIAGSLLSWGRDGAGCGRWVMGMPNKAVIRHSHSPVVNGWVFYPGLFVRSPCAACSRRANTSGHLSEKVLLWLVWGGVLQTAKDGVPLVRTGTEEGKSRDPQQKGGVFWEQPAVLPAWKLDYTGHKHRRMGVP